MQQVLEQINTLPGVIGSMVRSGSGQVAAFAFPPLFDITMLQEASLSLAEIFGSLSSCEGPDMIDFRFADGRALVKPINDAHLFLLCTKDVNLQVLTISLNVAIKKLEKLLSVATIQTPQAPAESTAQAKSETEATPGDGLYLEAASLGASSVDKSFEQLGMVAITQNTSHKINAFFNAGNIKKLKLINHSSGKNGVFPLMVVNDEDNRYDGMLILGKSIMKKLGGSEGDRLQVEALL